MDWFLYRKSAHIPAIILLEIIFIVLFSRFAVYNPKNTVLAYDASENLYVYPMFQDVHAMIFMGFAFLMSFLKKYGLSAVTLNMLLSALAVQWAALIHGFFHLHKDENGYSVFYADVDGMLLNDFSAASVLITFGVVIGKTTPLQLVFMVLVEIVLYIVNEVIGRQYIGTVDAGDTIFVHVFGACFGIFCSLMLDDKRTKDHKNQGSRYNSDLFSMIGTIVLWIYWPSFNSAGALRGGPQHRAVLNTYYSLTASVIGTFAASSLFSPKKKFVMEHIQNATLAGGVAIGAAADMIVTIYGALIVGLFAGILSTLCFEYLTPFIGKKLRMHDTCGAFSLHGVPGILGAIISMIVASTVDKQVYTKQGLHDIFPLYKEGLTASSAGVKQFLGTIITIAMAAVGGMATGFLMRMIGKLQDVEKIYVVKETDETRYYDDDVYISVNPEETATGTTRNGALEDFDMAALKK